MIRKSTLSAALCCVASFLATTAIGQVSLTVPGSPVTVDFTGFSGTGFVPSPAAGEIDSDDWAINGLSDGDLGFGATGTGGDYAKGTSSGGVSGGGVYAFDHGSGNVGLGFQPTGGDWTPGDVTLRIQNNTGAVIVDLDVAYDLFVNNNEDRGNSFNFSHSADDVAYTAEASLDYTSVETNQGSVQWDSVPRSITLSGVNIAAGAFYYLRWNSNDVTGGGSRDEFCLDNIVVTPGGGGGGLTANFSIADACDGDSTFLTSLVTGGTTPYTFAWDFDGIATSTDENPGYPFPGVGSYNIALWVYDAAGDSSFYDDDADVFPLPTISTSNDTMICDLDSVVIWASGANTYSWSDAASLEDAAADTTLAFPSGTTTYTVTGTDGSGCSSTGTVTITVDVSESPRITNTPYFFCSSDAPAAISAASAGGTWAGTAINSSTGVFDPATAGDGTHTISYTTTGACGGVDSTVVTVFTLGTPALFFSEYIESGSNKGIEIYNPLDVAIDLGPYQVHNWGNGGSFVNTFNLTGMLAAGDVYVIISNGSAGAMAAVADTALDFPSIVHFNGNDALALIDTVSGDTLDKIGIFGANPGSNWPVTGGSTEDVTLVRQAIYNHGDTVWTGVIDTQWDVYPVGTHDYLGSHTIASCNVAMAPVAAFSATTVCEGDTTTFTDLSVAGTGNVASWAWDFGDMAGTSTDQHPAYLYATAGTYTVQLIATNDSNLADTTSMTVTVNAAPVAAFTMGGASGCEPYSATLTDASTVSSGSITSWDWDFGNGSGAMVQDTSASYTAGMYSIMLTVASGMGCVDSVSQMLTVGAPPVVNETGAAVSNANCGAADGSVTGITATGAGTLTYEWFNAGMSSVGAAADLISVASGSFQLVVTDTLGCTDSSAFYTVLNVGGPSAPTVSGPDYYCEGETANALTASGSGGTISWYADSTLGTLLDTGASYTPINLMVGWNNVYVTETAACEGPFSTAQVFVNPKPQGDLVADIAGGCAPLAVTFSDSSTISMGTYTVTICDLDDGSTGLSLPINHLYTAQGIYNPYCVFTSDSGCVDTAYATITVSTPPVVAAGNDTTICDGDAAQLSGTSSGGTCIWTPGATLSDSTAANPMAMPTMTTTYVFTCTDGFGCSASDSVTVTVNSSAPVQIDPAGPFCENGPAATLTADQMGGTWSGTGIIDAMAGTFSGNTAGIGTHQIVYTTGGVCGSSDTIMVEVVGLSATPTDIFFSEYIEGSSNNKAVEIYNPLDVAVDLSEYIVFRYNNGSTTVSGSDTLSGMLQPGDVYVIANPSADAAIQAEADLLSGGTTFFNGDDALELTHNGTVVDVIGEVGVDPGTNWPVGTGFTSENTLVRMGTVVSGTTTWVGDGDTQWNVESTDDFSFLGWHNAVVCTDATITAAFTANDVCEGDTVHFADLSFTASGTITSWAWDFGDANTSTMQNPSHVYAATGMYSVTLIVTNSAAEMDTTTMMVNVFDQPNASFTMDANSGCTPLEVNFTNNSSIANGSYSTVWLFTGGSSLDENPTYTFTNAGVSYVTLMLTSDNGCVEIAIDSVELVPGVDIVDANATITDANCGSTDGSITGITATGNGTLSYSWVDGAMSQVATTVDLSGIDGGFYTLLITDSTGCENQSGPHYVANTGGPAAPAVSGAADYCEGETVDPLMATGAGGVFTWYGDMTLGTVLGTGSSYVPTLALGQNMFWVTETGACEGHSAAVTLNLNAQPTADFSVADTAGCQPFTTTFTSNATISTGTLTYFWEFGDGGTSSDQDPMHTFSTFTGPHTVSLTVTSDQGCEDELVATNLINVFASPNAGFTGTVVSEGTVDFTDLSGGAASWMWDFGDGNTSTDQNPTHTYDSTGSYTVTLTIMNADSCEDSSTSNVSVTVGIADVAFGREINVFPNPTRGAVQLDLGGVPTSGNLQVLNTLGQVVATKRLQQQTGVVQLNLSDLPAGQYTLRLAGDEGIFTSRVVLMK